MNKSELLLKAVDESAATTYTLTRMSESGQDSLDGVLDNFLRDVQIHDNTATAQVLDNGDLSVTTRLGDNLQYICKKYDLQYTEKQD